MMFLAYRHGMRASEVCGLRLANVELKAGAVLIRRLKGSPHTVLAPIGQPSQLFFQLPALGNLGLQGLVGSLSLGDAFLGRRFQLPP